MNVVTRKHLAKAEYDYPDAAKKIPAWYKLANVARWKSFLEVRTAFSDADNVDGYVIFNIRQNRYRLVTIVHYSRVKNGRLTQGHVYIRSFLTHRQFDNKANWDKEWNR